MNGWPTSFVQVLIFINVLFVTGLLKAVNKLFLNEKLWKCIFNSRIAFIYTDYEWNMTITVWEQFLQEV